MLKQCEEALNQRREQNLYRQRLLRASPQSHEVIVDDKKLLSFCSNDYLGLSNDPRVIKAWQQGADEFGVGSGSAALINGYCYPHQTLEEELAEFLGYPRVLLCSTGFMTNLGVLTSLAQKDDLIIADKLCHASIIDGGLYSAAKFSRFLHDDMPSLEKKLQAAHQHAFVVSDGVFSMDGDIANLPEIVATAKKHKASVIIDDAHGVGVLGESGRGILEHHQCSPHDVDILVGTFGKSFGAFGAYVAAQETVIESLIQLARPYIYTTALPAALAQACRASLQIIRTETWRREKLQGLIQQFRLGAEQLGLQLLPSSTPIQPLLIGDEGKAMRISQALREQGFLISAIRTPTVAKGQARLRITFSCQHEDTHVAQLLTALEQIV